MLRPTNHSSRRAFSLLEVLVSCGLVILVMGFLLSAVDQTRRTINSSTARVSQFQAARVAFEAMTRNLSQATLNTYWDLDYNGVAPIRYRRQADLHFVMDYGANFGLPGSSPSKYPTHAVFFQAPLGLTTTMLGTTSQRKYSYLANLLSVVGYYVEWNEDTSGPKFLEGRTDIVPPRFRYRLMEVTQPGEYNMVYNNRNYTTVPNVPVSPASPYTGPRDWISLALGLRDLPIGSLPTGTKVGRVNSAHVLAENVVALILIPKVSERDRSSADAINDLTTNYTYDSRPQIAYQNQMRDTPDAPTHDNVTTNLPAIQRKQLHQLPPIVQVTMVAIDEESAARLQNYSTTPPDWTSDLFKSCTTQTNFIKELGDPMKPVLKSLGYRLTNPEHSLPTPRMNYRVFTTDVQMRGSKWSRSSN